jgi:hypothetical protein
VLLITIGELKQPDQIKLRALVVPGTPAKFLAEFDGTKFCFLVTVGSVKKIIDTLDLTKLPDAARDTALVQLKKYGLI